MISAGYFTSTGNLKGNQTWNDLIAGRIINSSIKSALLDINSFSGIDQDLLSYVHAHLAALTGLTTSEENMLDGYESVIGSSFTFWAAKGNPLTKLEAFNKSVVIADALGFVEGWNAAVDLGYWYLAKYHAASVSITAAENFSWE